MLRNSITRSTSLTTLAAARGRSARIKANRKQANFDTGRLVFLRIARGTGKAGVVIRTLGMPSKRVARQRKAMKDLNPSDGVRTCCETN